MTPDLFRMRLLESALSLAYQQGLSKSSAEERAPFLLALHSHADHLTQRYATWLQAVLAGDAQLISPPRQNLLANMTHSVGEQLTENWLAHQNPQKMLDFLAVFDALLRSIPIQQDTQAPHTD